MGRIAALAGGRSGLRVLDVEAARATGANSMVKRALMSYPPTVPHNLKYEV
jgi:hypothetical protein